MRRSGLDKQNKRLLMKKLYDQNKLADICKKLEVGQCADCGLKVNDVNHVGFDWDHIDRTQKVAGVSTLKHGKTSRMLEEIAKCILRCATCHRTKSHRENDNSSIERIIVNNQMSLF
jgi:hypothetical protein